MTEQRGLGESRGGEGRAVGPTSDRVARNILQEFAAEGIELDSLQLIFVTDRVYALYAVERGGYVFDAHFIHLPGEDAQPPLSTPSGGDREAGEGDG